MLVSDFDYELPEDRIALHPPKTRGQSRILVLHRDSGKIEHRRYTDLADYLTPGDCLVINNTKVLKARLLATNSKGQTRELLLLEHHAKVSPHLRQCLYRGSLKVGETLQVGTATVTVNEILPGGLAVIQSPTDLDSLAESAGHVPLPPYIKRQDTAVDEARYQTVFASAIGSVAAPTASLNYTKDLQQSLQHNRVKVVDLTLHVGLGTFLPIRSNDVTEHQMHSEYFEISKPTIESINSTKSLHNRVVALGTTVARTLEFAAPQIQEQSKPVAGEADIFIYPGYEFKMIDGLLTNFHAPRSTVLMLAAAFAGWNNLKAAYQEALHNDYQFLSYGDSMLIL